jgi:peptidoglycan/xylan/chitin deacetylase (PgdA/CDA1 family)
LIRALAGVGASTAAALHAGPALAPLVPGLGPALGIALRQPGAAGVALTFDDGPHPQGTAQVLELLREGGAPATFFLVGEQVRRRPALVAEIVAAGHRVELHGDRHRNQLRLGASGILEDAERGRAAIEEAGGQAISAYRPAYGIFSLGGLAAVRRRGWTPRLWSLWGRDWRSRATPASIARDATAGAAAGDVLLLHDSDYYSAPGSWARTVAALPAILEALDGQGLKAVSLSR